jgi:hypothetical protein
MKDVEGKTIRAGVHPVSVVIENSICSTDVVDEYIDVKNRLEGFDRPHFKPFVFLIRSVEDEVYFVVGDSVSSCDCATRRSVEHVVADSSTQRGNGQGKRVVNRGVLRESCAEGVEEAISSSLRVVIVHVQRCGERKAGIMECGYIELNVIV